MVFVLRACISAAVAIASGHSPGKAGRIARGAVVSVEVAARYKINAVSGIGHHVILNGVTGTGYVDIILLVVVHCITLDQAVGENPYSGMVARARAVIPKCRVTAHRTAAFCIDTCMLVAIDHILDYR